VPSTTLTSKPKTPAHASPGPIQGTVRSLIASLKAAGTPSVAAVYRRHGVLDDTLGVRHADLAALARRVGVDHDVALALWNTGVHEARLLATHVADTARLTQDQVSRWAAEVRDYVVDDALAKLAAQLPQAQDLALAWIRRSEEYVSAAGWTVVGLLAKQGRLAESEARRLLALIGQTIHEAPNRTRYAMNTALIGIGGYLETLRDAALATARAIGPVQVDHGETGCKTPEAAVYIAKMAARDAATKKTPTVRPARAAKAAARPRRTGAAMKTAGSRRVAVAPKKATTAPATRGARAARKR
jgi:3-methyladenine DNA glycosylase AlkD